MQHLDELNALKLALFRIALAIALAMGSAPEFDCDFGRSVHAGDRARDLVENGLDFRQALDAYLEAADVSVNRAEACTQQSLLVRKHL